MTPHRIYILPTRSWMVLMAVLAAMWYAAISQGNSTAYLLMFFLGSLVVVSAIHCHFALAGLELRVGRIPAVFAGEPARVAVEVQNPTRRHRMALSVAPRGFVFKEAEHAMLKNLAPASVETAGTGHANGAAWRAAVAPGGADDGLPIGIFPVLAIRTDRRGLHCLPPSGGDDVAADRHQPDR